jgi:hypothetical protein
MATRSCRGVACSMPVLGRTGKNCPGYAFSVGIWPEFHNPLSSKQESDAWQPSLIYRDAIKQTVSCPLTEHTTKKSISFGVIENLNENHSCDHSWLRGRKEYKWRELIYLGRQTDYSHCETHSLSEVETIYRLESTAPTKHVLWTKSQSLCFFLIAEWLAYLSAYPHLRNRRQTTQMWQQIPDSDRCENTVTLCSSVQYYVTAVDCKTT